MNTDVIITCAITGAGDTTGRSSKVPVSPVEIADAAIATVNIISMSRSPFNKIRVHSLFFLKLTNS